MKLKVKGLRLEKYITNGEYSNYQEEESELLEENRYVLYCIGDYRRKYELTLWETYGECYSGYCGASWGEIKIQEVDQFSNVTHTPIKDLIIDIDFNKDIYEIDSEIIRFSSDGGDNYYPCGFVSVNMELFKETNRIKTKRPVWLFKGDSNIGKSYLGYKLNKDDFIEVYETDSSEELPNNITEDIIVLGNKYNFNIEDIDNRIFGEHELIMVDFKIN